VPDVPCSPQAPHDPVSAVRTHNDEAGIVVGPRTATPAWHGERLDVGYVIDVLHPLANENRTAA
jgi:hypothetical protein